MNRSIAKSNNFIGRDLEQRRLKEIAEGGNSAIAVVHGRRRVGKTTLIEQVYGNRNLIKFEGLENQPESIQQRKFLWRLAEYSGNALPSEITPTSWSQVFRFLAEETTKGAWIVFFKAPKGSYRIQRVLITVNDFDPKLGEYPYFERIIRMEELFK